MMTPLGDGVDLLEVSCQLKFLRRRIIVECFDQLNTHTHIQMANYLSRCHTCDMAQ